jgi:hypothetical protein
MLEQVRGYPPGREPPRHLCGVHAHLEKKTNDQHDVRADRHEEVGRRRHTVMDSELLEFGSTDAKSEQFDDEY